jgi:hypothetical protein
MDCNFQGHSSKKSVTCSDPMLISMIYPPGSTFTMTAHSVHGCWDEDNYKCTSTFAPVSTIDELKSGNGNAYHFANGMK